MSITSGTYYTASGTICAWISLRYIQCLSVKCVAARPRDVVHPSRRRHGTLPLRDHPLTRHYYPSYNIYATYTTTTAAAAAATPASAKRVYKSYNIVSIYIRRNASWRHNELKFFRFYITDTSRLRRRVLHGRSRSPIQYLHLGYIQTHASPWHFISLPPYCYIIIIIIIVCHTSRSSYTSP